MGALVFFTACLLPQRATAQADTLEVMGNNGKPGSQGHVVQLALKNLNEIAGLQLTVETSHEFLAIDSVKTTMRSSGMMPHWNRQNGKIILVDFNAAYTIDTGSGPVLEVFFSVSAKAPKGMITLNIKDVVLADPKGGAVPVVSIDGTFNIQ